MYIASLFLAIFGFKKWAVAKYFWALMIFEGLKIGQWPEKVGFWPVLKTKVATKNPVI